MATAVKKKKSIDDFELPDAAELEMLKQERAVSADRIAKFHENFEPTGSAFKDTSALSGTSRDVKRVARIDALLDKSADRSVAMRGQNAQYELGLGEIGVNKERNRLTGRGQDFEKEIEMRKADVTSQGYQQHHDVGMAEVGLQRDVFDMTKKRYDEFGRAGDELALARATMATQGGYEDMGFEPGAVMKEFSPRYLGTTKIATPDPTTQFVPRYNDIPMPKAPAAIVADAMTKGPSAAAMPYAGMSIGKMAGEKIGKGIIDLFNPPIVNKVRRKVKK